MKFSSSFVSNDPLIVAAQSVLFEATYGTNTVARQIAQSKVDIK